MQGVFSVLLLVLKYVATAVTTSTGFIATTFELTLERSSPDEPKKLSKWGKVNRRLLTTSALVTLTSQIIKDVDDALGRDAAARREKDMLHNIVRGVYPIDTVSMNLRLYIEPAMFAGQSHEGLSDDEILSR